MTTHEKALEAALKAFNGRMIVSTVTARRMQAAIAAYHSTLLSGYAGELVSKLNKRAEVAVDFNARYGRRGKDWSIEAELDHQAATIITALVASNAEMREAGEKLAAQTRSYQRGFSGTEPLGKALNAWDATARRARSAKEGE